MLGFSAQLHVKAGQNTIEEKGKKRERKRKEKRREGEREESDFSLSLPSVGVGRKDTGQAPGTWREAQSQPRGKCLRVPALSLNRPHSKYMSKLLTCDSAIFLFGTQS